MNVIVQMDFGSHLYGTATEDSDRDYKGIFMPSAQQVYLGRIPKSVRLSSGPAGVRNGAGDVDSEMYSLHHFIKLACEGQTVALDMLHAPGSAIHKSSDIWRALQARRKMFYSKNMTAMIGYAKRQAAKYGIKGSRLAAAEEVLRVLRSVDPETRLAAVYLPQLDHARNEMHGNDAFYVVCGRKLQFTVKVKYHIATLEGFVTRYGARAKAAELDQGVDWKALMHASRACLQMREIFTRGDFTYPLPATAYLRNVRAGRYSYAAASSMLEEDIAKCERLAAASDLPEEVDVRFWRRWLFHETACSCTEEALMEDSDG